MSGLNQSFTDSSGEFCNQIDNTDSTKIAKVYVVRPSLAAPVVRMRVKCDGREVGSTKPMQYVYLELEPGFHTITSVAENSRSIEINLEPGKTVYIRQKVVAGFL